jgi:hypothetical protein
MKTKTVALPLALFLSLAAFACTSDDEPTPAPAPPEGGGPAASSAPPPGSAPPAPPSPTQPPPAAGAPEHPPQLVGYWGDCATGGFFHTYLLREDGSAVLGGSQRPELNCSGGAPLPPASEPDDVSDCTWRVAGKGLSPSFDSPWLFFTTCDTSESIRIVDVDAISLTFHGSDDALYTYSRLD